MAIDSTLRWINLRQTTAFSTDGTNQTRLTDDTGTTYPIVVTLGGDAVNAGWESEDGGTPHVNIAVGGSALDDGCHQRLSAGQSVFRLDLPAPDTYEVYLAGGNSLNPGLVMVELFDDTASMAVLMNDTIPDATSILDACGSLRPTGSSWVNFNSRFLADFTTTTLRLKMGNPGGASASAIRTIGIRRIGPTSGLHRRNTARTTVGTLATTWTARLPPGIIVGDYLEFAFVTNSNANSVPANFPSGVTQIGTDVDTTTDTTLMVCWKYANSTDVSTKSLTFTNVWDTTENGSVLVTAYRGAHATSPITGTPTTNSAAAVTSIVAANVTPAVNGSMIRAIVCADPSSSAATGTPDTTPAATETEDNTDLGALGYLFAQEYLQATAAAVQLETTLAVSDDYGVLQYAIRPSVAGSYSLAVAPGPFTFELTTINLNFTEAYVIPVTVRHHVSEGQNIPFALTEPGEPGEMVAEGQEILLSAYVVMAVVNGQFTASSETIGTLAGSIVAVDRGEAAFTGQPIILTATGVATSRGITKRKRRFGRRFSYR